MPVLIPGLVLHGPRLVLRPSRPSDVEALVAILSEPAVVRWWRTTTPADVEAELHAGVTVLAGGTVAGWLLVHEETEPDYRHVAFDIALTTVRHDDGLGREALRVIIAHCVAQGHHRFTIDPAAANDRAIRCYAAVGFRPVGVLREQERGANGAWRDGLLMDLLARELVP